MRSHNKGVLFKKEVMGNTFRFKQFTVRQERCAMKVGTDGVLLGAWAGLSDSRRLLDIGTGTGLIALMCAQRTAPAVRIDAVEIDGEAAAQAAENIAASPFAERIAVYRTALQQFRPVEPYGHILCNPPYFTASLKCPDSRRSTARHNDSLPFSDLARCVAGMLTPDGCFSTVLPVNEGETFIGIARTYGLCPVRQTLVHPTPAAGAKRVLLTFAMHAAPPVAADTLTIELAPGIYTEEYIALTRDFYLKM